MNPGIEMIVTLALWTLFFYLLYSWLTMKPKNYPPGPLHFPVIGSAFFVPRKLVHITLAGEWLQKYGPVVGLVFGSRKVIAVCGAREVLEVLQREEFQARPTSNFFKERSFGKRLGVFFSDGPFWVEQRRFTLRNLRDFGFGKQSMEGFVMDEVEDTIKEVTQKGVLQVNGLFSIATLNVLWRMTAGSHYSRNDKELLTLLEKVSRFFRSGNPSGGLVNFFPILKTIAPGLSGHTEAMESLLDMQNYFRKSMWEHKETIDKNNPRDLMDVYLREMEVQSNKPDTTFTEEGLIVLCLDLFAAGGETLSSSLAFSLLYMILNPNVQKAVQKELDHVVGRDRRPTLADRGWLHYTEAVLTELFRVCSIAPVAPPHRVTKDTTLKGYFIPKEYVASIFGPKNKNADGMFLRNVVHFKRTTWPDIQEERTLLLGDNFHQRNIKKESMVVINLYSVFQDREHWGDPEVFRPERFLDADGHFVKDDWIIPFGVGKRVCIGEVLSRNTIFLFFTSLLQEFWFSVPEEDPEPSLVPLSGFTIAPRSFRVKATKRT